MKFNTVSGKLDVSSTHVPGRGSGIFDLSTGNHAEFDVACSLNLPVCTPNYKHTIYANENRIDANGKKWREWAKVRRKYTHTQQQQQTHTTKCKCKKCASAFCVCIFLLIGAS